MENLLRRVTHLLLVLVWLGVALLLAMWLLPAGVAFLLVGLYLFVRALQRGFFDLKPPPPREGQDAVRDAKFVVTQVLRNLTRVQVSYLSQQFHSRADGKVWLKRSLPKIFHQSLDELHSKLETARLGSDVPGLKLVREILERRVQLEDLEQALESARAEHPDHQIAHPMLFVVTEHLGGDDEEAEPLVVTVAGWDNSKLTLLPAVDTITFVSEKDGRTMVRGQSPFARLQQHLAAHLEPLAGDKVFSASPVEDPTRLGVPIDKVPLGFVIGAAEFL